MQTAVLMKQIIVIFLEVLLGVVGVKCGIIEERDSKFLSNFIMTIIMPCTMLSGASIQGGSEIIKQMGIGFVLTFWLFVSTSILCIIIGKALKLSKGKIAVLVGTAAMPNCGFIGIPLGSAILGAELGIVYATSAMVAYNIWFFTYITQLFRPGQKLDAKTLITPCNIATVVVVFLLATGIRLPASVQTFTSSVGNCVTPLALIIVGVMLAKSDIKAMVTKPFFYLVTVLRGIIFPILFMGLLLLVPMDNTFRMGMAIIAVCPAGSLAAVLAKQTGTEEDTASQAVALSTLFMLITVPLMLSLAGKLFPLM